MLKAAVSCMYGNTALQMTSTRQLLGLGTSRNLAGRTTFSFHWSILGRFGKGGEQGGEAV